MNISTKINNYSFLEVLLVIKIILILLCVLLLVVGAGFGYLYHNGMSGMYANTQPRDGQIKVACVGDSITYGHGVSGWKQNNSPAVLQQYLGEKYHVANFGSSGSCVNPNGDQPYSGRAVYQSSLAYDADILVFMLGSNDAKPENWTDTETFLTQYENLLDTYCAGGRTPKVFIGLCAKAFYVGGATSGPARYDIEPAVVDTIVAALRNHPTQATIIDIYTLTANHPEWFAADGIHPNKDGAAAIAQAVFEAIENEGRLS